MKAFNGETFSDQVFFKFGPRGIQSLLKGNFIYEIQNADTHTHTHTHRIQ